MVKDKTNLECKTGLRLFVMEGKMWTFFDLKLYKIWQNLSKGIHEIIIHSVYYTSRQHCLDPFGNDFTLTSTLFFEKAGNNYSALYNKYKWQTTYVIQEMCSIHKTQRKTRKCNICDTSSPNDIIKTLFFCRQKNYQTAKLRKQL